MRKIISVFMILVILIGVICSPIYMETVQANDKSGLKGVKSEEGVVLGLSDNICESSITSKNSDVQESSINTAIRAEDINIISENECNNIYKITEEKEGNNILGAQSLNISDPLIVSEHQALKNSKDKQGQTSYDKKYVQNQSILNKNLEPKLESVQPATNENNTKPIAVIKMDYDNKSYMYTGNGNVNGDTNIYKTTKIVWDSVSKACYGRDVVETEWQNKLEYYTTYGQQILQLRVKDSEGEWSDWAQVKFNITNRPPVANLKYVIMNPSSLVNGNITNKTQIAWLWSYNGQNFMYDPDGDNISNVNIDGIPSQSVIGYLSGGIGFATQFSTPAQYIMKFKCVDSNGAWSNEFSIVINVEPSDGNSRPICVIRYSSLQSDTITPIVWGWFDSYDPNPGDTIAAKQASLYKDGKYLDINNYITGQDADGCQTLFPDAGEYTLMFRVQDNKGAFSNWVTCKVVITEAVLPVISSINIVSHSDEGFPYDSPYPGQMWFNEAAAKSDPNLKYYGPEELLEKYRVDQSINEKVVVDGFDIKGKVTDPKGLAFANKPIGILFSIKGQIIKKIGTTDSKGEFSITINKDEIPTTVNTQYVYLSNYCTEYMEPTTLYVVSGGQQVSRSIIVNTANIGGLHVIAMHWCKYKGILRPDGEWESF